MPDFNDLYNPDLSGLPGQVTGPNLNPVNNPFQGYNPDQGINRADIALSELGRALTAPSLDKMLQPVAYDPVATNADRYQNSDYFGELGFNPFSNNEERYGLRQTNWNKLGNAFGGMWGLMKNQFVEQATSWGDTFSFFKNNSSAFEQADMEEISRHQRELMNNNPIFETQAQRDGIWNFNTIANTIQQSGYAVGAIAEIAAEELALSALTAATFGAASELQAARSLQLAAKLGNVLRKTQKLEETVNSANKLRKVFQGINRVNPFGDNSLMFLANLKNISRADQIAYGGSKLATARTVARGFGSFYRDVREFNAAIAEGKAEAAGSYQDLKETLTADYFARTGKAPEGAEAERIEKLALEAAQTNGVANTYLIMLSNKIGLNNVMSGFKPLRQLSTSIGNGILDVGEKSAAKTGVRFVNAADNKWLNFKQNLLRKPLTYTATNLTEALQENLQDVSNEAVKSYYEAKYNGELGNPMSDVKDMILEAAGKQFSVQGAKTFISGFMTGTVLGAGNLAFENAGNISQYLQDRSGYKERQAKVAAGRNELIAAANNIYKNPLKFDYKQGDTTIQANLGELLKNAAETGDKKAFYDIKDDALRHLIITGIRSNTLDTLLDRVGNYAKELSPEEFTTAFGIEYTEANAKNIAEQVRNFTDRAEEVKKIHEQVSGNLKNPFEPYRFKAEERQISNPEFIRESLGYKAWNDAVDNLVFIKGYYEDTMKGQASVLAALKDTPGFDAASFNDLYSLTSQKNLDGEIDTLKKEVESLSNPGIDAQTKVLLDQKKNKLKLLSDYKTHLDTWAEEFDKNSALPIGEERNKAFEESFEKFQNNASELFGNILNAGIEENTSSEVKRSITQDNLANGFVHLHNYLKLQKESGVILDKVNLLADPENFSKFFTKHDEAIRAAYNMSTSIKQAMEEAEAEAGPKQTITVKWSYPDREEITSTFTEGQVFVGKMSKISKYKTVNKSATQFNNDKIKIVSVDPEANTITLSANGDAAVTLDAEEVARLAYEQKWIEYNKLTQVQKTYLNIRNTVFTYQIPVKDKRGALTVKESGKGYVTKQVQGRVRLNDKKDTIMFVYKDGGKEVTTEFNPKWVVNKIDLSKLPDADQAFLIEQQARIQRNYGLQVKIFEDLYNQTEEKLESQKQLIDANKEEFSKLSSDIKELQDELDIAEEELARIKGKRNVKEYREQLKQTIKIVTKELGQKNLLLERLTNERDELQKMYEAIKESSLLYAEAFMELEDQGTPFDRGSNKNIYDDTQSVLNQTKKSQLNKRLDDQEILDLLNSTEEELADVNQRIKIISEEIKALEKFLNKVLGYDDLMEVLSNVEDPRQQTIYLMNLKRSEVDPDKKALVSALLKSAQGQGIQSGIFFEQAKNLKELKRELSSSLEQASALQDKYDRLALSLDQRGDVNTLQERVNFLKKVQEALTSEYSNMEAKNAIVRAGKVVTARTKKGAQELAEFGDILSAEPVIFEENDKPFFDDSFKPRLDQIGLFKTADRHYWRDTDEEPTSEYAARFFKFSEHVPVNGDYFFQVVTAKNDTFGIRAEDQFKDDIKLIAVKKVGNEYKPVGVDGVVLEDPTKDTIVYTSVHGNDKLLGTDEAAAIKWVEENFGVKGLTEDQIKAEINKFKAFRESIKERTNKGESVYLNVQAKGSGVQAREPLDVNTNKPQQLPLTDRLLHKDTDWVNMKHPDGSPITLEVSTTGSILNKKIKAGRVAMVKQDGSVFQVYNRQLNSEEKSDIIAVLKNLVPLMGRRYLTSNSLNQEEQDTFDKSIAYLTSVLYWKPLKQGETPQADQFYIANGMLHRHVVKSSFYENNKKVYQYEEITIPFSVEEIEKNSDKILEGVYHQVNNKRVSQTKDAFYAPKIVDGQVTFPKETKWANYNQYLLDSSNDRTPPVYTNVKPYTPAFDIKNNQLRQVYLVFGYNDETAAKPVPAQATNAVTTTDNGKAVIYTPTTIPKEVGKKVVFVKKRADKVTDLFFITEWDGNKFVVTKMVDEKGEDFTSNKDVLSSNESFINTSINDIAQSLNAPLSLNAEIQILNNAYHRIESYVGQGQTKQINQEPAITTQASTGTATGSSNQSTENQSTVKPGQSYTINNGTASMLIKSIGLDGTIHTVVTMNETGEKLEGSGTLEEIKQVIAQATPSVATVTDKSLEAKIAAARAQAALNTTTEDPIDENARLALTERPEVVEDLKAFEAWLKERLPQIPMVKVSHLINGRNWGQFIDGVIKLYQNAAEGTGYHEAFEAVWNSYLTEEEQQLLAEEFKARPGTFKNPYSNLTKKHSEATMYDVREMLADEFIEYVKQDKAVPRAESPVRNNLFRRLWNFIKNILGMNTEDTKQVNSFINTIYSKIETGGFVNATAINRPQYPTYKALPETTVDFTQQVMEGMGAIFFSKLYSSQNNIEALFSKGDNSELFKETYKQTNQAVYQYFNGQRDAYTKALIDQGLTDEQVDQEIGRFIASDPLYDQKQLVLEQFNGKVYEEFRKFLGQFGLEFKKGKEANTADQSQEDLIEEVEGKEFNVVNALGIQDSIYIDPRNMTKSSVRLLIASLTADEYKPSSNQIQIKKNGLGLPTLADYGRKINVLLNELHSTVPVYRQGKRIEVLDQMFEKLDNRFKQSDGKYRQGFEWIQKLRTRLKYGTAIQHLSDNEVRMLIGFESSFSNNKNLPVKLLVGEDGYITGVDPVTVTNIAKIKERWQNKIKSTARMLKPGEDLVKAPISYINAEGKITFNLGSENIVRLLDATTPQTKLEALRKLGIDFTQSNNELLADQDAIRMISDAYNSISYSFKKGLITTFDDLFGKQVVNGPMNQLLSIELAAVAEDNSLSHQNAEGKQQFSITLPSAISNVLNSLKAVDNIDDFILSNPQYGGVAEDGTIRINSYLENSQLFKLGGVIFDRNGTKKKDIDYQYILGMSLLSDNEGSSTDSLKFPDKIVQEIYHLLNGTYFTVINSDKSSEFGMDIGHFISWEDIKQPVESNSYIQEAYTDALVDEINAAVDEFTKSSNIQYYSKGVTMLGHFRDVLGFKDKNKSKLQQEFEAQVLTGKESPRDFATRPQVKALIVDYVTNQVEKQKQFLINQGLVEVDPISEGVVNYKTQAFSKEQLTKLGITNEDFISETDYTNLIKFMAINRQIGVFEQHKLLYGHPAMYKDLAKRSNGINSQKQVITENKEVLSWMDSNMSRYDNKIRSAQKESTFKFVSYQDPAAVSMFHKELAQGMYDSMIADGSSQSEVEARLGVVAENGVVTKIPGGKGTFMEAYVNANEPDGGAYIMPDFFRDMLFLSGKLDKAQEARLNWEHAVEVIDRSNPKSEYYKEYLDEEIAAAKAVLAEGEPKAIIQTLKPQGFGYQTTEGLTHTTFLKHSVFPITWTRVKNNPTMAAMYIKYQSKQVDIIGFESGEKVGNVLQNGDFVPLYNLDGQFNDSDLPIQEMFTKYYGIQVEMPSKVKEKVILGTQMRKLVLANLPESLKDVSKEYFEVLKELMRIDKIALIKELGLQLESDGSYSTDDLTKLIDTLRSEAISRDLPDNVIDMLAVETNEDSQKLQYKFDANPIREKIDNILNSIVDSRVISQKMFGKASVQVPVTMWESSPRKFVFLRDGVWTNLEGNQPTEEEQKTIRMTSSDLKFYTKEEPWMEVYLPWFFGDINPAEVGFKEENGIWVPEDGKKVEDLLRAIGFRIPTQGMNSIENIRIKGFLKESLGDVVIVPTEIVGKSGSDFDIDKMNLFLANFYVENNQIKYIDPSITDEQIKAMYAKKIKTTEDANKFTDKLLNALGIVDEAQQEYINKVRKQALQNRLIELMSDILSHPDNYRQLVMPNGSGTLENLADEIRTLKGQAKEGASLTKLSEWDTMALTRERYISGKKLVGIGALQVTSHTISQIGNVELTGEFTLRDGSRRTVNIKFNNNSVEGKYILNSIKDKGNQYISELLSEALTGFVDAAKNPFVFDLNLNTQTAATWFYLQKLGVPVQELAYLHTQPLIESYFREQAKNESFVKKANDEELEKDMVIFKAAEEHFQLAFGSTESLYELGKPGEDGKIPKARRQKYFKLRTELLAKLNAHRASVENYSAQKLRINISIQNKPGYKLTKEDALEQLSLLYDYLDYQEQAGFLTTFINALSYDTARTKNIIENRIQESNLKQAYSDKFITSDSIDRVFDDTFLGEVKTQKEDIFKMFKKYFVVLHPNAEEAFDKVLNQINNPALGMTKDKKIEVLNRFQNFFINYLLHTTKFKINGQEKSLNEEYPLFFGDDSLAKELKEYQEDPKYKNNKALKELFPLINTDRTLTDNIKLFNNKQSTYDINSITEALLNLKAQAEQEGNTKLITFVERLGILAILQSGVQLSPITYTKILPIEIYSEKVEDILKVFTDKNKDPDKEDDSLSRTDDRFVPVIDADLVWKQFHQNNWFNSKLVPKVKRYSLVDGLLRIGSEKRNSKQDYLLTRDLKPEFRGKVNPRREDMIKLKRFDELYDIRLWEKIKIYNGVGVDITDQQPGVFFRPINRLGNKHYLTEAYLTDTASKLGLNEPFEESSYDAQVSEIQNKVVDKTEDTTEELPCDGGTPF